jgi:hypothetical protein
MVSPASSIPSGKQGTYEQLIDALQVLFGKLLAFGRSMRRVSSAKVTSLLRKGLPRFVGVSLPRERSTCHGEVL